MTTEEPRVVFDHRDDGTAEHVWREARQWKDATATSTDDLLKDAGRLVVVCAHPDDETLGCGGLMAVAAARGVEVTVVVATLGEMSHPSSPTHPSDRMAQVRSTELRAAVARVAPKARIVSLPLPDGHVEDHSESLCAAIRAEVGPDSVVAATWRHDGHPDHEAVGRAAAQVCTADGLQLLEYPIWTWQWAAPSDLPWHTVRCVDLPLSAVQAKRAALAEHVSQTMPLSDQCGDEAVLGPAFQQHFIRTFETYFDAELISPEYFDRMLQRHDDPWNYEASWYEERKRAITMACLPHKRFDAILEIGCSTGVLTTELATRAEKVTALDHSQVAISRARQRLGPTAGVSFQQMSVPGEWPAGSFDLIVLSEVGYYWSASALKDALDTAVESLTAGGSLLLVHWRHPVDDRRMSGDEVHNMLDQLTGLDRAVHHLEPDFRLDLVVQRGVPSVAQRERKV